MAQPTQATTEHAPASGHGGGFPPFKAETYGSQLIWLGLCFVVLYVMVAKLALPRMASILADRRARIDGDLAEAVRLKGEADAAVATYEKALADARNRAHTIASETRERLARESEAHRKSVEADLAHQLAEAEKTIAAGKTAAMTNVRGIAVEAAGAIVAQLVGKAPSQAAAAAAVDHVLKR